MANYLDIGAAITAFIAAAFWFASAYGNLPPILAYWDKVPEDDPYYMAVKFSARMNRVAAAFSGLSALLVGLKLIA